MQILKDTGQGVNNDFMEGMKEEPGEYSTFDGRIDDPYENERKEKIHSTRMGWSNKNRIKYDQKIYNSFISISLMSS